VYGEKTDAVAYLQKFVHFFLTLPRPESTSDGRSAHLQSYLQSLFKRHGLDPQTNKRNDIIPYLVAWALALELSLRDLEKAVTLFVLAGQPGASGAAAFMIALKIKNPDLVRKVGNCEKAGLQESIKLIDYAVSRFANGTAYWPGKYFDVLKITLQAVVGDSQPSTMDEMYEMRSFLVGDTLPSDIEDVLKYLGNRLDLSISNL